MFHLPTLFSENGYLCSLVCRLLYFQLSLLAIHRGVESLVPIHMWHCDNITDDPITRYHMITIGVMAITLLFRLVPQQKLAGSHIKRPLHSYVLCDLDGCEVPDLHHKFSHKTIHQILCMVTCHPKRQGKGFTQHYNLHRPPRNNRYSIQEHHVSCT